jgi:hypothetical protein
MELDYDTIQKWMKDYFQTYNLYAQNPDTIHKMDRFFAPNMEFFPYVASLKEPGEPVNSREDFYKILAGHPSSYEMFEPEDIVIDERRGLVVALLQVQVFDSKTNEVLLRKSYLPLYKLILDENRDIKIKTIQFFWEVMPPGVLEVNELFAGKR